MATSDPALDSQQDLLPRRKSMACFMHTQAFPWLWSMVGAGGGVYLFIRGFQLLQRKRLIMNTPASKIRSAAMGLVEVSGLAAGPYTMPAPITGLPCYYYRTMAWEWRREGKNSKWVKVADESLHFPFYLEDNTGHVLVNPQGAELEIHRDFHEEFSHSLLSSTLEIPANVSAFLLRRGVSADSKIKVEEYCIKPKNALFVLGTLAENPGLTISSTPVRTIFGKSWHSLYGSPADAQFPQASSVHLDSAQQQKMAAVLTKAGITNPMAWAVAGIDSTGQPGSATATAAAPAKEQFDLHPASVLMKGMHNPSSFISWRSQKEVVQSLAWKSAMMIWGGPALTLLCIYVLMLQYGNI